MGLTRTVSKPKMTSLHERRRAPELKFHNLAQGTIVFIIRISALIFLKFGKTLGFPKIGVKKGVLAHPE